MDEYIAEIFDQWENGNRESVCQEILARPNPAVTAVYFAQKLIAHFGSREAGILARLLDSMPQDGRRA